MKEQLGIELSTLHEGMNLPALTRKITQENIDLYAQASGDFNPIHIDQAFAQQTPMGGTIAHGMLVLAYISNMMTLNFGQAWLTAGHLNVRFKAPARPGDTVTISGTVGKIERDTNRMTVKCDLLCRNQNAESVIISEAWVSVRE